MGGDMQMPPRPWRQRLRPGDGEGHSDSGPDADGTARSQVRGGPRLPSLPGPRAGRAVRAAGLRRDGRCALGLRARRVFRGPEGTRSRTPGAGGAGAAGGAGVGDTGAQTPHPRREGRRWRCGRVSPGRDPASQAAPGSRGPGSGRGAWVGRTPELGWPVAAAWMRRRDAEAGPLPRTSEPRGAVRSPTAGRNAALPRPDVQRRQTGTRCPETRAVAVPGWEKRPRRAGPAEREDGRGRTKAFLEASTERRVTWGALGRTPYPSRLQPQVPLSGRWTQVLGVMNRTRGQVPSSYFSVGK